MTFNANTDHHPFYLSGPRARKTRTRKPPEKLPGNPRGSKAEREVWMRAKQALKAKEEL